MSGALCDDETVTSKILAQRVDHSSHMTETIEAEASSNTLDDRRVHNNILHAQHVLNEQQHSDFFYYLCELRLESGRFSFGCKYKSHIEQRLLIPPFFLSNWISLSSCKTESWLEQRTPSVLADASAK